MQLLLVSDCLYGVEVGGFLGGVPAEEDTDGDADDEGDDDGGVGEDEGYGHAAAGAYDGYQRIGESYAEDDAYETTDKREHHALQQEL